MENTPLTHRLPAKRRFIANAIMGYRNTSAAEQVPDSLSCPQQPCSTIPHSTNSHLMSLVCALGHINQISFLHLNIGIFISCSPVTLAAPGQASVLLVLMVDSELACPDIKTKMSLSFLDKAADSFLHGEELSKHR